MAKANAVKSRKRTTPVRIERLGANIGAEASGVDLTRPIPKADFKIIRDAFVEHEVLIFRNQNLTQDQYIDFVSQFGEITIHPFATSLPDHPELIVLAATAGLIDNRDYLALAQTRALGRAG